MVVFSKAQDLHIASGASNYIVSSKESFYSLNLTDGPSIQMGYDTHIQAEGKGTIQSEHGILKKILYVPSLETIFICLPDDAHWFAKES